MPVMRWRITALVVGGVLGGFVYGFLHATTTPRPPAAGSVSSTVGAGACSLVLYGQSAEVTFSSADRPVQPLCAEWAQAQARLGELWQELPGPIGPGTTRVCEVFSGSVVADVSDTPSAFFGQQACEQLLADGWREGLSRLPN